MGSFNLVGKVVRTEPDKHQCANARLGKMCMCDKSDLVLVDFGDGHEVLYKESQLTRL